MRTELIHRISSELHLPLVELEAAVRLGSFRMRKLSFAKKNGESRVAYQAAATVKPVLHWLRLNPLACLPVSPMATAFRKEASTVINAKVHRNSLYSVRIDIQKFFPSITKADIQKLVLSSASLIKTGWNPEQVSDLVGQVCFDRQGRLPIGFPTSPGLANAIMYELDSTLLQDVTNTDRFGCAVLTRYADDFVFSTNKRGACSEFLEHFRKCLGASKSPSLRINEEKTRFMSRGGGSTIITGLRITNQATVRVHADYRDHVRLLLRLYAQGRLSKEEHVKLAGHLAYVESADPKLFTRLSFKFSDQISEIRRGAP